MLDLFGNPKDRFSRVTAHIMIISSCVSAFMTHLFNLVSVSKFQENNGYNKSTRTE